MKAGAALDGMPRCEGRSDGPGHQQQCPENRSDSTVHRSQGDLMLCNACELYRFPALAAAGSKTDVTLASRRRKGSMATTSSHSSTTTTRPNTRNGQQTVKSRPSADDDGGDPPVVAATTRGSDARRHPGDSDTDSQVCCKNADTNMERSCRPTRIINMLPNTSQIAVVLMIVTVNRIMYQLLEQCLHF